MESYCQSYAGQFNVVICQNDNEAYGAMTAMDNAGVTYGVDGDVIIVSFDSNKPAVQKVLDGEMNATSSVTPWPLPRWRRSSSSWRLVRLPRAPRCT